MILAAADALAELARTWEDDARVHRRYNPADPAADLLERVAADLRRVLGETAPQWVPLASVAQWTGWSRPTLRKRCRDELAPRGMARKVGAGEWEVAMEAAVQWPRTRRRVDVSRVEDLAELARIMGREE